MNTATSVSVAELDFHSIRENFKRFLDAQGFFTDYDFEGSGLTVLLDLLAYNAHYTGVYANLLANELFLDSAVRRDSIVSHAKALGYVPASTTASRASVGITFSGITQGTSAVLPAGTQFIGSKDGTSYTFLTLEPLTVNTDGATAVLDDVEIHEGSFKTVSYLVDTGIANQRFSIPDPNVDINHIEVYVQNSPSNNTGIQDVWTRPSDYALLDGEDKVFFIQEGAQGKYEIYFGDGIIGKAVSNGNLITVKYLVTNGSIPNGIGTNDTPANPSFTMSSDLYTGTVNVVSRASGGSNGEALETIRRNAPLYYQAQGRCVTKQDYEATIKNEYSYADAVHVWGGEENDPPMYGKVFIAIKPTTGFTITDSEKSYIKNRILKPKNVVTIDPVIVDPEYLYVLVNTAVIYDRTATRFSQSQMEAMSKLAVVAFDSFYLGQFDSDFRFSKFVASIDSADPAIVSNVTRLTMQRRVSVVPGTPSTYIVDFGNPLFHPHEGHDGVVWSETFKHKNAANEVVDAFVQDDGAGALTIREFDTNEIIVEEAGTIDYDTGKVNIDRFNPVSLTDTTLKVYAQPEPSSDIFANRSTLIRIDFADAESMAIKAFHSKNDALRYMA